MTLAGVEGDGAHRLARRLSGLAGATVVRGELRVPRYATARLEGAELAGTEAYGKHLLTRFDTGWTLHTHLRMTGVADPARPLVEALLDQRGVSGLGNLWAVELCFLRGRSPWAPVGDVDLPPLLDLAARMLRHSLERGTGMATTGDVRRGRSHWVYGRAGRPCLRCGTPVLFRPATRSPYAREVWWCPACQRR
jgi:formamidopyrimidine-DNA glycosylase